MNEAISRAVDGFMRSKQRDAIVACLLFALGWQFFSPFMALCAAGFYVKLMRNKERRQLTGVSRSQKECGRMKFDWSKLEAKDWLLIVGVAGYCLFPIDLIPDVPFIGWIDDIGLASWAIKYLRKKCCREEVATSQPTSSSRVISARHEQPSHFDDDVIDAEYVEVKRRPRR